ncbi:hypothetical protein HY524_00525 [Candidatus Berkelbacteria bacterium]|nr:hypothetical protein [Candidatus Berkelbacteria bacterium]
MVRGILGIAGGNQVTPSWDLFLTIFFIVGIAYGMMLQRERAVVTLMTIYVGLVVTQILTEPVSQFFLGEKTINSFFIDGNVSPFTIQAVLFIGTIIVVSTKGGLSGERSSHSLLSPIEVFVYSFLNTALIATTLIAYLPEITRSDLLRQSSMASFLAHYHTYWLLLPIAALIFFGWSRRPFLQT